MATTREQAQIDIVINGTKATSNINEMTKALKVMNAQLNEIPKNSAAFKAKAAEIAALKEELDKAKGSVKGVSDEAKNLGDRFGKLDGGNGFFSNLKANLKDTKTNLLGATNGLSGFQLGLFGVIGAVVALVGYSLYSYFTKTDEGATKLQGILGGLKAALDRLVAGFVSAGKWIVDAFSKPKEALTDIVDFLKSQVEVRVQALGGVFQALGTMLSGDLKQGFKDLTNAQIDFATGVENTTGKIADLAIEVGKAGQAAYEMAQAVDALEDAERGYSVVQNINKNLIDELLLQSKNRGLEEEKRIAKLKEAGEIENQDFEQRLALAKQGLDLAKKQNEIDRAAGKDTDEMAQREVDAVNKILQLENESIALREKIANREAALMESMAKDREKAAADKKKKQDEELKELEKFMGDQLAFYRKMQDSQIALIEDQYEQRRETARAAATRELEDAKLVGAQKEILAAQLEARLNATIETINREEREKRLKNSIDDISLAAQTQEAAIQLHYAGRQNSERDQTEALYQIRLGAMEKELQLLQLSGVAEQSEIQKKENAITLLKADAEKRRTEDARKSSEERKRIQALELQGAKQATEGVMSLIEEVAGENAKATIAYKAFATADAVINGVLEIQRIWAQYGGIPGGQIIAGVLTGVSAARTAIAVSKINAVQASKPKFARGGVIREGSLHKDGGIRMVDRSTGVDIGELERNETILTGGVQANPTLLREASDLNVRAGGRPLYADGGIVGVDPTSQQNAVDFSKYLEKIDLTNQLLMSLPTTLKAEVKLNDFEDKQTLQSSIKENANA